MTMGRSTLQVGLLLCGLLCPSLCADDAPLHRRIDALMASAEIGPVAGPADDATFIRRASLDLIGRIPTRDEVESFLSDETADKRAQLVERLLASGEYARNMAVVFDLILMERRGGKHVSTEDFRRYLEQAFAENRSYLDLVREILSADGTNEKNRAASAYFLEREVEPHLLTRDVGRIFFGVDLQCAQCHDHPLIDDYHQPDYYGLHAFFLRSSLFRPDNKQPALIAEAATGESSFKSVFTDREGMIGPRVPGGDELASVTLKPTEQYEVAPAKNVRAIPHQSRREQLAAVIADDPSPAFNRNIVNRLWAHMFGQGLVHPVDLAHSGNPATHPEVLELLANDFAASGYNVQRLLRELALTQAYQRSFRLPPLEPSIDDAIGRIETSRASAEKAAGEAAAAEEQLESLIEKLDAAIAATKPFQDAEANANKQLTEALKKRDDAQAKVTSRQQDIDGRQSQAELLKQSVEKTKAAAEALKDDKELAAALATIEKRAAAHEAELQKQLEAIKPEQSALTTAQETLKTASTAADEAIAARVPHEEAIRSIRGEAFAKRDEAQRLRTAASTARHDADYLELLVAYSRMQQQNAALTGAIAQHEQSLTTNATVMGSAKQQVETTEAAHKKSQAEVAAQQNVLTTAETSLKAIQQTQSQLAESIAKAETALPQLSDDEQVTEAVALLKESLTTVGTKVSEAQSVMDSESAALKTVQATEESMKQTWEEAMQVLVNLQNEAAKLTQRIDDDRTRISNTHSDLSSTWDALVDQSSVRGNVMGLTPLTPEQLGWSILTATGQIERQRAAETAKLDKEKPLTEEQSNDPEAIAARAAEIEAATRASLNKTIGTFIKLYGAEAGQPQQVFFATADQTLFAANGNEIRAWLQPAGENLTARLIAMENNEELAGELYVSILSRPPTPEEIDDVKTYIANRTQQKNAAVQELAWGLLTSAEFRFRH